MLGIPGLYNLRESLAWQVIDSNNLSSFGLDVILQCHLHGRSWIAENPVQRSDRSGRWKRFFSETFSDHGSWWQIPQCREVAMLTNAIFVDVAMCFWGLDRQKYVTLMMSHDLQYVADALSRGQCLHTPGFHKSSAGLTNIDHGDSKVQYTGAYPDSFCKDVAYLLLNPGSTRLCSIDDEPTCVTCDDQPAHAGLPADSRTPTSDPVGRGHKVVQSTVTSHEIHNTFCHGETMVRPLRDKSVL